MAAGAGAVLFEPPLDVGCDARVETFILTAENVNKVHRKVQRWMQPGQQQRPAHSLFELRAHPLDMLPSCFRFLDGDGPTDPLVTRERSDIFPILPAPPDQW